MKLNANLIKATLVGALGGLLFGFDTAVISGTTHALRIVFNLDEKTLGFTVMIALLGTIVGSMFAGIPGQKYGGRETLRVLAACYVISALGCAFAWNWPSLLVFRFIGGLGIGGSSVMGPVYIAEIAPAKWRGRLVGLFQINIVLGILLAYFSNYFVGRFDLGAARMALEVWRRLRSRAALFRRCSFRNSAQPALAGEAKPSRRSARGPAKAPARPTPEPKWRDSSNRSMPTHRGKRRIAVSLEVSLPDFSGRSPSACSTSSAASTPSSITSTIFLRPPVSAKCPATCRRSPSAPRICSSRCWR